MSESKKEYYKTHLGLMKGKKHNKETREKMGKAQKERFKTYPPTRGMTGQKHSKETREKMSNSGKEYYKTHKHPKGMKGKKLTNESREKISKAIKLKWQDNSVRKKMIKGMEEVKRPPLSEEHKKKLSKIFSGINSPNYGKHHSKKTREKQSNKHKKLWENQDFVKMMMKAFKVKPNKPEIKLTNFLNENYPGEWTYNGDFSQGITIGGKIPDWVNVNGEKKVIEVFGEYWHSPLLNPKVRKRSTYMETIKNYKRYGFGCLIIWSEELNDMGKVKEKIDNWGKG